MTTLDLSHILDTATVHASSTAQLPDPSTLIPSAPTLPSETGQGLSVALSYLDTALTHTSITLPDITSHHDFVWQ